MDTIIINSDSSGGGDSALGLDSSPSVLESRDCTVISNDQLEGTLYRTQVYESQINVVFQSRVLFDMFLKKVHSDFRQSVEKDETTFVSKCSTHIKGVKCDLKLDSHFKTVELSGIGFRLWREERFPKVAQSLFRRLMEEVDSQLEEPSTGEPTQEELSSSCFQQDVSYTGNMKSIPCIKDALFENNGQSKALSSESSKQEICIQPSEPVQKEFTAEKLSIPSENQKNNADDLEQAVLKRNIMMHQSSGDIRPDRGNLQGTSTCDNVTTIPMFTSTPIFQRQDGTTENSGITSMKVGALINKIDQLDSSIKTLKSEIIQKMELELNELKGSLIRMIENVGKNTTYADSVRMINNSTQQHQVLSNERPIFSESCAVDEGYGNLSDGSYHGDSSQTQLKRVYSPATNAASIVSGSSGQLATDCSTAPQPVPVRITNRADPGSNQRPPPPKENNRTLLVGDSLLKGVNSKGLKNGVTVCAKGGATIKDIWSEISVYNLNTFHSIVVCVGGNDASKRTDTSQYEDKYDELLSFIRSANRDCIINICKVAPRGDVDVSCINASIKRVAEHWKLHKVKCIEETYDLLFDKTGVPGQNDHRYKPHLGNGQRQINTENGQTRRLYQGNGQRQINTENGQPRRPYQGNGIYMGNGPLRAPYAGNELTNRAYTGNGQSKWPNMISDMPSNRQLNGKLGGRKRCFYCSMPGHVIADCWYAQ